MASRATSHLTATVSANLVAARKARSLTQREVAEALGVHEMRISNWERGRSLPSAGYEQALADFYFNGDPGQLYVSSGAAA